MVTEKHIFLYPGFTFMVQVSFLCNTFSYENRKFG